MAISLGSEHFITVYYILDPICSQQRARDLSKTAGNCCEGNIEYLCLYSRERIS